MSLISAIKHKLGLSVTTANNFVLDASANNGTMKLARESGQDIMTVAANGTVSLLLVEYANDSAAATGGVPIGGLYKTTGTVKVRAA